ncbi:MAG: phospholipase D-like domain-containing protein, partial [Chitinophagales bacterium]|nr:phospholipase D-like domain-containing protein [Chitinophagales bacterium]
MRSHSKKNNLSVTGIPGTTGILLAFDVVKKYRKNFLGFSIYRETTFKGQKKKTWLKNLLQFPDPKIKTYEPIDSKYAPIQKFRWSDYSVYPDTEYSYTIYGYYSGKQELVEGPSITVQTLALDKGKHQVIFNRAVAASQAFERAFPNVNPDVYDPKSFDDDKARKWLSRGLLEKIQSYITQATAGDRLDVCIYEFELQSIVDALNKAKKQGAEIRIVYHAKIGDEQTLLNVASVQQLNLHVENITARLTNSITHNKFVVLSKKDAALNFQPQQVLTGSTNFTQNGTYRQGNVVHVINDSKVAAVYSSLFEELLNQKIFD